MEEWKEIPSLPEYVASSFGRVMRVPYQTGMPYGGFRTYGGQPTLGVWCAKQKRFFFNFRKKNYKVARLVCEAFHGPAKPKEVCIHIDEDSRNNRPENLKWGTQKENLNCPKFLEYAKRMCPIKMGRKKSNGP
jgi:hypothetical protein